MYRTGKSYLLNRVILNRSNGFGVGPTINPCTKGIWVWGKPLKGQTPEGEIVNLIVIDSEGIGALDESPEHDARIFSLTILICSCFIYNSLGSIDENAIQNLHLMANITKNIHLKSKGNEEVESDEYAQYFPSFLWVVRDFALQLVDEEGDAMTPKEYLESALAIQKGFSDTIENKNRIRRMIQSFFKERDCYTMVRPLVNDGNLPNLASMDVDQLRPEFTEQVLNLRRRITSKAKMKTLNGKPLSGFMLAGLLQSYVASINEGAVPNIENAWSYICKSQCNNALVNSYKEYEEMMLDATNHSWPMAPDQLISIHRDCREQAIRSYKRAGVGEYKEHFLEELEQRICDRLSQLETENKREFERILQHGLAAAYQRVEKRLNNGEYKDFFDFEKELRNIQSTFFDMEPNGPNKDGLVAEFLLKKMPEGIYAFLNSFKKENEIAINDLEKQRLRLERDLATTRDEGIRERNRLQASISELEISKSEMTVHIQCVTENLTSLKEEKEELEKRLGQDLEGERENSRKLVKELHSQIDSFKDSAAANERKLILLTSEFEKEKALMAQKLSFYELSDKSLNEKEKNFQEEISRIKEENNQQLKQLAQKNRELVDGLEADVKTLTQRLNDTLDDLREAETEKTGLQSQLREKEAQFKLRFSELTARMEELETTSSSNARSLRNENESATLEDMRRQLEQAHFKLENAESDFKQREEDFKLRRSKLEKEKAVLQQNIEFLEAQLKDMRTQLDENKKVQEVAFKAFEGTTSEKVDFTKQLDAIKDSHKKEIKQLEGELANTRKRLTDELMDTSSQKEDLERQFTQFREEAEGEISSLNEQIAKLNTDRDRWLGDSKTSEEAKFRLVKEIEERFKSKMVAMEKEIEELKDKNMREIAEVQQKSEEDFKRMKQFFEEERLRLETKILQDKDRYEKKLSNTVEEYDQKIARDQQYHEEEIENLQEDLKEMEIQHMATVQHLEQELTMRQQQLEQLERQLKETKDQLRQVQLTANSSLEQALRDYSEERKNLNSKLEQAKNELAQKEKDVYSYRQINENLKSELEKIKEKREEKLNQLTEENKKLNEKVLELTSALQKVNEQFMENRIEYGKNVALSQQQNEFYSKRIEELQKQLDDFNRRTEEKLRVQRESHQQEVDKLIQQSRDERLSMEDKYEAKRRALKEAESKYTKRISEVERDNSSLSEKLSSAEAELSKLEKKFSNEIENLNSQIASLKESLAVERRGNGSELEKYKKKAYELELENAELTSAFEKDKALWEGKFAFLEQQRDQYKEDAAEVQKNFEVMLQKFQKFRNADKEETATSQSALVATIEQRYNSQITELNETHRAVINDLQEKIQKSEREIKNLTERLQSEGTGRNLAALKALEAKVNEQSSREQNLNDQILFLKNDRDQKIIEYQQMLERERESWKKRMNEIEARYKEVENKKNAMMFDHEKERAKWNIEKDHLNTQRNDFLETIDKLEKKKEDLTRENEKYKTEIRKNKKIMGTSTNIGAYAVNMISNLNSSKFGERSFNRDPYPPLT